MPNGPALLVSVKPHYAELLLSGAKTVELRRVRPRIAAGALVLIYASAPAMQLVGTATVAAIASERLDEIWRHYADRTGLDRPAYDSYFVGRHIAVAITLADVRALHRRIPLAELRRRISGFQPPQSFRYLPESHVLAVT
jgi:predicted transcriptional regulator